MNTRGRGPGTSKRGAPDTLNSVIKKPKGDENNTRGFVPILARGTQQQKNISATVNPNVNNRVSATIAISNSYNIGNKTLEDVTMHGDDTTVRS